MTVAELRKALEGLPDDAKIFTVEWPHQSWQAARLRSALKIEFLDAPSPEKNPFGYIGKSVVID